MSETKERKQCDDPRYLQVRIRELARQLRVFQETEGVPEDFECGYVMDRITRNLKACVIEQAREIVANGQFERYGRCELMELVKGLQSESASLRSQLAEEKKRAGSDQLRRMITDRLGMPNDTTDDDIIDGLEGFARDHNNSELVSNYKFLIEMMHKAGIKQVGGGELESTGFTLLAAEFSSQFRKLRERVEWLDAEATRHVVDIAQALSRCIKLKEECDRLKANQIQPGDVVFRSTGDNRIPEEGEWYVVDGELYRAGPGYVSSFTIYQRIEHPADPSAAETWQKLKPGTSLAEQSVDAKTYVVHTTQALLPAEPPKNPDGPSKAICRNCQNTGVGLGGKPCPCGAKPAPTRPSAEGGSEPCPSCGYVAWIDAMAILHADNRRLREEVESVRAILKPYQDNEPGDYFEVDVQEPGSLAYQVEQQIRRYAAPATPPPAAETHDPTELLPGEGDRAGNLRALCERMKSRRPATPPAAETEKQDWEAEFDDLFATGGLMVKYRPQGVIDIAKSESVKSFIREHVLTASVLPPAAESEQDWEAEFDKRFFMDLDGKLRMRCGVDGIFSRNKNAEHADIKAFIREVVLKPSAPPQPAAAGEQQLSAEPGTVPPRAEVYASLKANSDALQHKSPSQSAAAVEPPVRKDRKLLDRLAAILLGRGQDERFAYHEEMLVQTAERLAKLSAPSPAPSAEVPTEAKERLTSMLDKARTKQIETLHEICQIRDRTGTLVYAVIVGPSQNGEADHEHAERVVERLKNAPPPSAESGEKWHAARTPEGGGK